MEYILAISNPNSVCVRMNLAGDCVANESVCALPVQSKQEHCAFCSFSDSATVTV